MRKSAILLASVLILGAASAAFAAPKVGEAAPAFTATDSNGAKVSLADFAGKYVILEWTNADCPYVKKHYGGNMQALQKEAKDKGVVWLSVISSAPGKQGHVDGAGANKLTADRGAAPAHVLLDPSGAVGKLYDARTTPHMFLIDPQGQLLYMGGIDDKGTTEAGDIASSKPYVKLAMEAALAGKKIADANTRPYGCSVKYSE